MGLFESIFKKREEVKKANQKSKKHPMPNANVKMNKAALEEAENMNENYLRNLYMAQAD